MSSVDPRISLADLAGAGIHLRPSEAVAVLGEIVQQVRRGDLPGVPSAHVIRFSQSGAVTVEGPVAASGPDVARAAHLLDTLLAAAPPRHRASGALRLVIARALGTLDLPPFASLDEFADALSRFGAADLPVVVSELYAEWSASIQAGTIAADESKADAATGCGADERTGELSISDIRRARRETRLTLTDVSERSRIPAWLLRELEWGYFRNWPAGLYGRTQLVRYARAAGLDERLVVRTLWPLLTAEARRRGATIVAPEDIDPADPQETNAAAMLVPLERGAVVPLRPRRVVRRYRFAAAAAVSTLLGIAALPAAWDRWFEGTATPPPAAPSLLQPPRSGADLPSRSLSEPPIDAPAGRPAPDPAPRGIEAPAFAAGGAATFTRDDHGVVRTRREDDTTLRVTRVADEGANPYHASLSPDGRHVAFDSDRDGERGVYVADANGANVRRVSGGGFAALPSWSPDGQQLLFARAEADRPDVWNLWSVDLASGRETRLTSHESGRPWGGSWFPDGRRVAYALGATLVVLEIETGRTLELRSPVHGRPIRSPAVSPDGGHVVVQVLRDGAWLLAVPDGASRRLIDDPTAEQFSWAPDGRRLAYHSERAGGWNVWVKTGTW